MRVIAGTAKSLPLLTTRGAHTRPTTDRIKETLFNIISDSVTGCRFLDLFAGSGSIGIEALSRGAIEAVFVESSSLARRVIRANLDFTALASRARIIGSDAVKAVVSMDGEKSFDIIFMDPPYGRGYDKKVLEAIRFNSIVSKNTMIIIEEASSTDFSYVYDLGFEIEKDKLYGTNRHLFLRKK